MLYERIGISTAGERGKKKNFWKRAILRERKKEIKRWQRGKARAVYEQHGKEQDCTGERDRDAVLKGHG